MNVLVLLIASILFLSALSLWVWTRKRIQSFESYILELQAPEQVVDKITAVNAGSIGLGGRFLKLEKELQALAGRVDQLHSQFQHNSPFTHAINLAQKGCSAQEIMELCSISYNEAQLILTMHAVRRAAA